MIVADASVIIELVLQSAHAQRVRERLYSDPDSDVYSPHLLDVEVVQVIRRYVLSRDIDALRGEEMVQDYLDLPINRFPHELLLRRMWELRDNLTAYDAAYVALAELLGATLVTRDRRLQSIQGLRAAIEVL